MAAKRGGKSGRRPSSGTRPGGETVASATSKGQVTRWWHRFSGRGRWLALAGLLGALAGAAAGWWGWGQVTYRITGQVQLGLTHATNVEPESIQALRMDQVVQRELSLLRQTAGQAVDGEHHGLIIEARRTDDAQTSLEVIATSPDAEGLADDLRIVLAAYRSTTNLTGDAVQAEAWNTAVDQLLDLRAKAAAARSRLAEARAMMRENREADAAYAGPITELDPAWSAAIWTQNEARRAKQIVQQRLEQLEALPEPDPEQVAALDPEAAEWWGRMRGLNALVADAVWPPNPVMAQRLRERAVLQSQLQERTRDTRVVPLGDAGVTFRAVRLSETRDQLTQLQAAQEAAEQRVGELEPRLSAWRTLNAQVQQIEAELAEQQAAINQLDPGSGVRLLEADVLSPDPQVLEDGRPLAAGLTGATGFGLGLLITGLFFVFDNRVRQSRDGGLVGSTVPVLGTVPSTDGTSTAEPVAGEQPSEVASIQSVRAVLESKMRPKGEGNRPGELPGGAFAVTGITSGSGTTSVAVGLAVSMALSGNRVLLIDLAWLQKPAGSGTDDDAARDGLGIDGVIEELGYLDDEDREALTLGDEADVGFGAILRGVSLRRSVVQTRVPGLAVLSAMGRAKELRAEWAGRVSSRWLGKLMEVSKRGGYTATILDAGSATGSVEGMLGCAAADGTVVVVSGGQTQADYDKAVTRLRLVGATILGTVLNRSDTKRLASRHGSATVRRANAAGGTTGSGIFAAAIEARAGAGSSGAGHGSGHFTAPLPRVEDEPAPAAAETEPAAQTTREPDPPAASIPPGVDPYAEPPAQVQPTPTRQPPARADAAEDVSPELIPEAPIQASAESDEADTDPAPAGEPAPEVHVADDVMDQLVDHAIRAAAQRPRPPQPPAESSSS